MPKSNQPGPSITSPNLAQQTSDEARERRVVSRAIKAAIKQISIYDPELAETLKAEIKSGAVFSHSPKGR
jgi:hypothetical protein